MCPLPPPWSGLRALATRLDAWELIGPPIAATWVERVASAPPEPGNWTWPGSEAWPGALDRLPFGPVALDVEGCAELLGRPAVAIVGARACTSYGMEWADRLSRAVAAAGGVVVSGMARGIDTAAHAAAPGRTIAVLGCGLDAAMAGWQSELRQKIVGSGGTVISEYPRHQPPTRWTFPVRNRVISGLSRAVVVVEAGRASGALGTAGYAVEQGREVLAVPGPLGAPASEGCLELIEQGAQIVRGVGTVLQAARLVDTGRGAERVDPRQFTLDDWLQGASTGGMGSVGDLAEALAQGEVERLPGGRFRRTSP
jgi:DNA protecting protein DprA